ncbi:hypothetical protein Aut01nite_20030 [Actinoplanes utahensis]|nr:hypothetical protein Aut01nite_20030 [Actinoplanes utahensis]
MVLAACTAARRDCRVAVAAAGTAIGGKPFIGWIVAVGEAADPAAAVVVVAAAEAGAARASTSEEARIAAQVRAVLTEVSPSHRFRCSDPSHRLLPGNGQCRIDAVWLPPRSNPRTCLSVRPIQPIAVTPRPPPPRASHPRPPRTAGKTALATGRKPRLVLTAVSTGRRRQ